VVDEGAGVALPTALSRDGQFADIEHRGFRRQDDASDHGG
jgi:hypothetical protein